MNTWEIKVLHYGKATLPKSVLTPGFDQDLVIDIPYLGFLLRNGERNVLVDTGISDKYIVNGKTGFGGFPADAGRKYVLKSLAEAGIEPKEIDTILLTHLHNDHAGNCDLFENAMIISQQDDWMNLLDPLPLQTVRGEFDMSLIPILRKGERFFRIDGDFDFTEGIKLMKTPGHSIGSQSVVVNTKEGIKVIVGDHFHFLCMAFPFHKEMMDMNGNTLKITPAPAVYGPSIPSGLIYDYYAYYKSTYKIKSIISEYRPEYIFTGHDPAHLHYQ
jgi:glyoxylase-like metal-dependent hydrolase (beta-lactamase superfamily II)